MRRSIMLLLVLPVALASCDQGSSPPPKQQITVRSDGQNRMHQLNELNRAIALKRALYIGADESVQVRLCEDVVKAGLPACVIKDEAKPAPKQPS